MPHCRKCGAAVADGAGFCPACGAAQSPATAPSAPPPSYSTPPAAPSAPPYSAQPAAAPAQGQMAENVTGLLCYVLGWITGIIFYMIDKRPFVRFHAAQSIVVFGGLMVVQIALTFIFGFGGFVGFSFAWALHGLVELAGAILWVVLMVKAYQGERFRVPVAAEIAEKVFGRF